MSSQEHRKLNQMLQAIPKGAVMTTPRLTELGVSPQLARKYVQNGWLDRLGSGAFSRCGDSPDWLGGVYALQSQLKLTVHVGAVSALELQGRAHFVPLGEGRRVTLVSDRREHLPKWFTVHLWSVVPRHRCIMLFDEFPGGSTSSLNCGDFSVAVSAPERAIMECMHLARSNSDVEHALLLMEGLSTLRPSVVQLLLENCTSVKAKRLFLWSAERVQHSWLEQLRLSRVELGKGKRQLFKGGQLHPKYLITVPPEEELPHV